VLRYTRLDSPGCTSVKSELASSPDEIDRSERNAIVFSGGGIMFAVHAGVMAEMSGWTSRGKPWLDNFSVVVGTSAGALYGALYASGFNPAQIAFFARLFADPKIGPKLFDRNYGGFGAALVRHDSRYALGAVRGMAILSLLETVFSREVHARMMAFNPAVADDSTRNTMRDYLDDQWQQRQRRKRDSDYFKDQLTFADCRHELFIIGVNAYNGQKTIFRSRSQPSDWEAERREDSEMYEARRPPYLNAPGAGGLKALETELRAKGDDVTLEFRRFVNRVYRGYDTQLYGAQLPLALAVRASSSIPVIFEPLRIKRWHKPEEKGEDEDLFIDGGVNDNFSLSVAADPFLGNAKHVLGIFLGNLGYRLPDAGAADSIVQLLNKTTGYMGDALMDLGGMTTELAGHHVLVVDALASVPGTLTDTQRIGDLIDDGRSIARDLWQVLHPDQSSPQQAAAVDWATAFAGDPQAIYLSTAARGFSLPNKPRSLDTNLRLREILNVPLGKPRFEWLIVYGLVALAALGAGTALFVVAEAIIEALAGHPVRAALRVLASLVVGIVSIVAGVLLARLWAYGYWNARGK